MGQTQKIGTLGENLVIRFLMKRGYTILDRNYRRPWGELDIVAEKKGKIHFVEVKSTSTKLESSVSSETELSPRERALAYVKSGLRKDRFRPEDHLHQQKSLRLRRIIATYLKAKHVSDETDWQFDLATALIDNAKRKAHVNFMEGLVF